MSVRVENVLNKCTRRTLFIDFKKGNIVSDISLSIHGRTANSARLKLSHTRLFKEGQTSKQRGETDKKTQRKTGSLLLWRGERTEELTSAVPICTSQAASLIKTQQFWCILLWRLWNPQPTGLTHLPATVLLQNIVKTREAENWVLYFGGTFKGYTFIQSFITSVTPMWHHPCCAHHLQID